MTGPETISYDITFHGRVQGVGFRYASRELALAYPSVSGWVANHWDGSVRMHVQGPRQDVNAFIIHLTVQSRLARLIEQFDKRTSPLIPDLKGFRVEH